MAHGDYHCCAVCDARIAYGGWEAETKEHICSRCVAELARHGIVIPDVDALVQYIDRTPREELQRVLAAVGFRYCRYPNGVDDAAKAKGISSEMLGENRDDRDRRLGIGLADDPEEDSGSYGAKLG